MDPQTRAPAPEGGADPTPQDILKIIKQGDPAPPAAPASRARWLTPGGGMGALICFFLPWAEFNCMGMSKAASGFDLAQDNAVLWLVLVAAAVVVGAFFAFRAQGQEHKTRPVAGVAAAVGLGLLIWQFMRFQLGVETEMGRVTAEDIGLSLQPGAYGTAAGFVLALMGLAWMGGRSPD